jgi:hypothetical protein
MTQSLIDAELSPDQAEAINTALQTIRDNLSFLVALSTKEKQRLFKIGTKAQTFVDKALTVAEKYPTVVPQHINVSVARRNLALFSALAPILQDLKALNELVECTQMLAGSKAYTSARLTYRTVKTLGKDLGLAPIVDDLSRQFHASRRRRGQLPTQEAGAMEGSS